MNKLVISERQIDDVVIFDLSGDIIFGEGNIALRNEIRRVLGEGKKKIFLNMANVCYVDSCGIGELISGLIAINREEGQLKLLNLSQRIRELLEIAKLLTVFETDETEDIAIGKFN